MRLTQNDIALMLRILELPDDIRRKLETAAAGDERLTLDDADQLRDLCGERLQTHGFGPHYELTEEGAHLERLIDELFVG